MDNFKKALTDNFNKAVKVINELDDVILMEIYESQFSCTKEEILNLGKMSDKFQLSENNEFYSNKSYELLVESDRFFSRQGKEIFELNNNESSIKISLGPPTKLYAYYLFLNTNFFQKKFLASMLFKNYSDKEKNFINVLHQYLSQFITVRVECKDVQKYDKLKEYAYSFMFTYSFNMGESLVPIWSVNSIGTLSRKYLRRNKTDDIEFPKIKYIDDLIYHYEMALHSNQPVLEYLSYYHILEHFYSIVLDEHIIDNVKEKLYSPGFSQKRASDIRALIKIIKNTLKTDQDNLVPKTEKHALILTLKKFIYKNKVMDSLKESDNTLIDFYSKNIVSFSSGKKIDFSSDEKFYDTLADRIYNTRNAVIHSKAEEINRFIPFKHEKILQKEIPLLQIISEQIIIKSGKEIS